MAQRRMFSLEIVDTDQFLDLPASSQCLYFHLGMRADDCGFVGSPRKITAMVNCSADDLKLLIAKGYVIPFDSGVCVIRDWKVNNYIQKDRYHETRYLVEKSLLTIGENQSYSLDTSCIQTVSKMDTEVRLELGKSKASLELGEGKPAAEPPCPPEFGPELRDAFEKWLLYKKERREGYKQTGLKALITQIKKNAAQYGENAVVQLIETAMASGWKGIAFDRLRQGRSQQNDRNKLRTDDDYWCGGDFLGGDS